MAGVRLRGLTSSKLYQRRQERLSGTVSLLNDEKARATGILGNMSDALANAVCERCRARFDPTERIVNSNGELYHENCFVCAQCFRQFPDGLFYDVRLLHF
ncbi:hypothetical protein Chor_014164 [Crotalus horridus]